MPRDVSGNYTLPSGVNPVVNNTLIDVAWANPTLSDIATQLNNVLTRDGLLGPILPLKLVDGTVGAPSLCFGSQPTTGFYKTTSGFGFSILGTNVLNVTSTEFQIVGKTGIGSATGSNVGLYVYKSGSAGGTNDSGLFVRQDGTDPIAILSGNGGAEVTRIDRYGRFGLGTSISAWGTSIAGVLQQVGGSFYSFNSSNLIAAQNTYHDGTNPRYVNTAAASSYVQSGGDHYWTTASSGTAGNTITPVERMRIDLTGNFIVNVNSAAPTLNANWQMVFALTSNTNLRVSVRGSDGTTRVANITLA